MQQHPPELWGQVACKQESHQPCSDPASSGLPHAGQQLLPSVCGEGAQKQRTQQWWAVRRAHCFAGAPPFETLDKELTWSLIMWGEVESWPEKLSQQCRAFLQVSCPSPALTVESGNT